MPKRAREWGALDVKRAAHSGTKDRHEWHAVGGVSGLLLQITPSGSKSWVLRTVVGGQRRAIGLGSYPEVGIAAARDRAREAKDQVVRGIDPIEQRKVARAALAAARARALTFEEATVRWIDAKLAERPEKSRKAILSTLTRYAFPEIGKMTVQAVGVHDVVRAVGEVWSEKPDTGQKLRQYVEAILAWATVAGYRQGDNPARWAGNLKELLPAPAQVAKGKAGNFPAVPLAHLSGWWKELCQREGTGAYALRFAVLTVARSGEVRGATWDEIDLGAAMWTIPPSRMKMQREHRVPLSQAAVDLLRTAPRQLGNDLVFPSPTGKAGWRDPRSGKPAVPHGVRSTFRDWCAEVGFERDLAEIALAHQVGSDVERAYRRSDMLERRRAVMTAWADRLAGREADVVVPIRAGVRA